MTVNLLEGLKIPNSLTLGDVFTYLVDDIIQSPSMCAFEVQQRYEERAAIMEYDAKMPREQAEKLAELEIYHKKSGENHD